AWDEVILAADPVERLDSSSNESSSEEASEDSTVEESVSIDQMAEVLSAWDEPDYGDDDETEEHQAHDLEETDSAYSESTDMKMEDSLAPLDEIVSEEIREEIKEEIEDEIKDEAEDLIPGEAEDVVAESEDTDSSSTRGFAIHWETKPEKKGRELKANQDRDSVRSREMDTQGRSAESASKAPASASPESGQNQTPELPAFRSLHDMLQASGVSIADKTHATRQDDHALIQEIVGLDEEAFQLFQELGYASLRHLARLSDTEIYRLAAIFRIPEDRIRQEWKPTATAHLNMRASESIRK
ncbi:MAG: hypothetical protein OXT73_05410, partial [Bacteroidota bacterium]|nr:hypothetical protein [Bacteroidota bacterium]